MRRLVFVLVLALLAGCSLVNDPGRHQGGSDGPDGGSQDGSTDGGAPIIPVDELCGVMARLVCTGRAECCPDGVPDRQRCIDDIRNGCESELEPIFAEDKVGYSPERAAEVVERGRALVESCNPDIVEWYTFDLLSVMRGMAPIGQSCTPTPNAREDPASFFSCRIDEDLVCRPVDGNIFQWSCQGISPSGGECVIIQHCRRDANLYCAPRPLSAIGRCETRKDNGVACEKGAECASLFCDEATGQCAPPDQRAFCIAIDDLAPEAMSESG